MLISQILQAKAMKGILTVAPGTPVAEAATILSSKGIGAIGVSQDGLHPAGIITERDIVRELGKRGTGCLNDDVDMLMTKKLITCTPNDRAIAVLQKMTGLPRGVGRGRASALVNDAAVRKALAIAGTL
ncbi:MAG: CBS domain-containing protein [Maritimibacter sp.]